MASLHVSLSHSTLSLSQSNLITKPTSSYFNKRTSQLHSFYHLTTRFKLYCGPQHTKNQNNEEEPPESLFMKELKRRGMTPTSVLEEERRFPNRNSVQTNIERSLDNQRERSMALNSEGLEGLIPRARLLLTLGGTFFLAFWPFILLTVASFSALYFYFGPIFIHDGSNMHISPPQYVDPYELLEDERISQIARPLN
ncbi:PREDICTED: uncharacterized protein LOC109332322 isoform X3 [Lupinus angustifolius]|uniref:uncharacterized protein LOC109332322 isoform X3 n=1 Tax=Lupinus angustifolius TaxID=3871 RepID=UPI00092E9444|nr:PREDICTED: uncharacterized protein LOC109332322 isoform X3 [Lupinus angustifolius]